MFEDAEVTGYEPLIASMTNNRNDRHVLAAAVRCSAHAIVTANLKHFPAEAVQPYGIEVISGDDFLIHQLYLDAGAVLDKLHAQSDQLKIPLPQLLQKLARPAPAFAAVVASDYDCL